MHTPLRLEILSRKKIVLHITYENIVATEFVESKKNKSLPIDRFDPLPSHTTTSEHHKIIRKLHLFTNVIVLTVETIRPQ